MEDHYLLNQIKKHLIIQSDEANSDSEQYIDLHSPEIKIGLSLGQSIISALIILTKNEMNIKYIIFNCLYFLNKALFIDIFDINDEINNKLNN